MNNLFTFTSTGARDLAPTYERKGVECLNSISNDAEWSVSYLFIKLSAVENDLCCKTSLV